MQTNSTSQLNLSFMAMKKKNIVPPQFAQSAKLQMLDMEAPMTVSVKS